MGRKKLIIKPIVDPKLRNITYNKRKLALLKKAAELSVLCNSKMFLAFTDTCDNLIIFVNPNVEFLKEEIYHERKKKIYSFTESDYPKFFQLLKKKDLKDLKQESFIKKHENELAESKENLTNKTEMIHNITHLNLNNFCPKKFKSKNIHKIITHNEEHDLENNDFSSLTPKHYTLDNHENNISMQSKPIINKCRKLSIKIPTNKGLEYKMNMIKFMNSLNSKSSEDFKNLNNIFLKNPLTGDFNPYNEENLSSKEENQLMHNSKSEFKFSLDSTNSVSKPQLSSLLPSCEKNSGKNLVKNEKNKNPFFEQGMNKGKRKFFEFIDDKKFNNNIPTNNINKMPFTNESLSQNTECEKFQVLIKKKNKSLNQELHERENLPINSLYHNKISRESYIHELVRNEKLKHSFSYAEDFCEDFNKEENIFDFINNCRESPQFLPFSIKDDYFKKTE